MSSILASDLHALHPASGQPRYVGQIEAVQGKVSATSIVLGDEKEPWRYGPELPIEVALNALEAKSLGGELHLYWSGIAVTGAVPEGSFLVAALSPASEMWQTNTAPFLPPMPDPEEIGELRAAAESNSIHTFPYDPFDQDPDRSTARVDDPFRLPWESGAVHGDGFLKGRSPNRSNPKKARWCFAICPQHPEIIIDQIFRHYEAQLLLQEAEQGTISRKFQRGNKPFDVIQPSAAATPDGFSADFDAEQGDNTRKKARTLRSYGIGDDGGSKVAAERLDIPFPPEISGPVLRTAIRQALAGRHHRDSKHTLQKRMREHFSDLLEDYAWRESRSEANTNTEMLKSQFKKWVPPKGKGTGLNKAERRVYANVAPEIRRRRTP